MRPTGFVLHEDDLRVVIATGFGARSANRKTGDMVQVWILAKAENPVAAVKSGHDSVICGDCPHRGDATRKRSCYVNVGQAPLNIWRAWTRGRYPKLTDWNIFFGRAVRFGAYGDPVHIPLSVLHRVSRVALKWTGGHRSHCADCGLCSGAMKIAKNIAIIVHGSGARNFVALSSLAGAA